MTTPAPRPRIFTQIEGPLPEPRRHSHLRASLQTGASPLGFTALSPAQAVRRGLEMTLGSSPARDTDG